MYNALCFPDLTYYPSLIPVSPSDSDTQPPNIPAVTWHSQPPNTRQITSARDNNHWPWYLAITQSSSNINVDCWVKRGACFSEHRMPDVCLCQGVCIYQSLCESFEQFMLWGWKEQDVSSPNYKLLLLHRRSLTKLVEQKVITKKSFSFILKID